MFGIKIIKDGEYNKMKNIYDTYQEYSEEKETEIRRLEKDCESLRQQLNDKMKEVNKLQDLNTRLKSQNNSLSMFKRDTLEAMANIDIAGFQFQYCTKKCKHCKNEQPDCKKYEFGKHQFCVIPK